MFIKSQGRIEATTVIRISINSICIYKIDLHLSNYTVHKTASVYSPKNSHGAIQLLVGALGKKGMIAHRKQNAVSHLQPLFRVKFREKKKTVKNAHTMYNYVENHLFSSRERGAANVGIAGEVNTWQFSNKHFSYVRGNVYARFSGSSTAERVEWEL